MVQGQESCRSLKEEKHGEFEEEEIFTSLKQTASSVVQLLTLSGGI